MTMFMETTQVEDVKTVAEVQHLLARRGATSVMVEYKQGRVEGLAFRLTVGQADVPFRLPCRWSSVETLLRKAGRRPKRRGDTMEAWARRIAWRQILRWVEAQLALIETGMVKPEEVFLPYAIVGDGDSARTIFQLMEEQQFKALPAPKGEDHG